MDSRERVARWLCKNADDFWADEVDETGRGPDLPNSYYFGQAEELLALLTPEAEPVGWALSDTGFITTKPEKAQRWRDEQANRGLIVDVRPLYLSPPSQGEWVQDENGDWFCPKCQEGLDGSRVTNDERCDTCGTPVVLARPYTFLATPSREPENLSEKQGTFADRKASGDQSQELVAMERDHQAKEKMTSEHGTVTYGAHRKRG